MSTETIALAETELLQQRAVFWYKQQKLPTPLVFSTVPFMTNKKRIESIPYELSSRDLLILKCFDWTLTKNRKSNLTR